MQKNDLIYRQAAIDALRAMQTYKLFAGDDMLLIDQAEAQTELMMLPSAQPDMSEYSDKLWKAAYERGKAEGREKRKKGHWIPQDHNMKYGMITTTAYFYPKCSRCGNRDNYTNFCSKCGADMRGEQDA